MHNFIKSTLKENNELYNSYVGSLSGIYDDFLSLCR
jgi:hypothetical protein